jgi:hypothetical protein
MQIITLVEKHIIVSDEELNSMSVLRNQFINYFDKLEKLWIDFDMNRIDETEATKQFYEFRELKKQIEKLDDEMHLNPIRSLHKKSDTEANNYISQYHF